MTSQFCIQKRLLSSFLTETTEFVSSEERISKLMVNVWILLLCSVVFLILAVLIIRKLFDRYLTKQIQRFEPDMSFSEQPIMMPDSQNKTANRGYAMKNSQVHSRYPDPGNVRFWLSAIVLGVMLFLLISNIKSLTDEIEQLRFTVDQMGRSISSEIYDVRWEMRHTDNNESDSYNRDSVDPTPESKPTVPILVSTTFRMRPDEYSFESAAFPAWLDVAFDLIDGICPDRVYFSINDENDNLIAFYQMTMFEKNAEKCFFETPIEVVESFNSYRLNVVAWTGSKATAIRLSGQNTTLPGELFGDSSLYFSSDNATEKTFFSFSWEKEFSASEKISASSLVIKKGYDTVYTLDLGDSIAGKTAYQDIEIPFIREEELPELTAEIALSYQSGITLYAAPTQCYYKTSFYSRVIPGVSQGGFRIADANGNILSFQIN